MVRDIHKDKDYWDKFIVQHQKELDEELENLKKPNIQKSISYIVARRELFSIVEAKYSRGDDVVLVKQDMKEAILWWKNNKLKFDSSITNDWSEYFSFSILSDMDPSFILKIIEEDEKKRRDVYNRDWILHFLGSKGKNLNLERKCASYHKLHENIKNFIKTNDISHIHNYMKKWAASAVRNGSHKQDNYDFYCGYWDFNGAAVVKLLGLNKDEFKDYKYFPYDLV